LFTLSVEVNVPLVAESAAVETAPEKEPAVAPDRAPPTFTPAKVAAAL